MLDYSLVFLVYLLAGGVLGMAGFGSALIAVPLLSLFLDMSVVVPLASTVPIAQLTLIAWQNRAHAEYKYIRQLGLGSLPGIAAGVSVLHLVPDYGLKLGLGLFLWAFVSYSLTAGTSRESSVSGVWGYIAGCCCGGFTSAISAGGPPAVVYLSMVCPTQKQFKGTMSLFFVLMSACIVIAYGFTGLLTRDVLSFIAVGYPAALVGNTVGVRFSQRFSETTFRKVVYALLVCMGGTLITGAVRSAQLF